MTRKALLGILIYTAVFVLFTLFFIVVNYPSERLTDQVNAWILPASKGTLTAGSARLKPLLSLEIGELDLNLDHGSLDLGKAVVKPGLLGIITGKRAAEVNLENPWLSSNLSVVFSGESLDLKVPDAVIDLSRLPEETFPVPLKGEGKVEVSAKLFTEDLSREIFSGDARITSGPISVSGGILEVLGFAPLKITSITAVATVENNVLKLGENAVKGDLNASAAGVIKFSPADFMASRLDLTIEIGPGPGNRERLMPIFALVGARPRADGNITIRIRGTVGRPSITM